MLIELSLLVDAHEAMRSFRELRGRIGRSFGDQLVVDFVGWQGCLSTADLDDGMLEKLRPGTGVTVRVLDIGANGVASLQQVVDPARAEKAARKRANHANNLARRRMLDAEASRNSGRGKKKG